MSLLEHPETLRSTLRGCLDVPRWVDAVTAGAPYADADELLRTAQEAANPLLPDEVQQAVADHPPIGAAPSPAATGASAQHAGRDQASITGTGSDWAAVMAEANLRYQQRFGRVFLIRAAGRSGPEILAELERRITLDDATELAEVGVQLREIALVRLRRALDDEQEQR